jgi:hypothetical protein
MSELLGNLHLLFSGADEIEERGVLLKRWPKPAFVELAPDRRTLLYRFTKPLKYAKADRSLVTDFLKLGGYPPEAFPDEVLRYARRWGPLQLCRRHERPASHGPEPSEERSPDDPGNNIRVPSKEDVIDDDDSPREYRLSTVRRSGDGAPADTYEAASPTCPLDRDGAGRFVESLDAWRFWSRQAREVWKLIPRGNVEAEEVVPESGWLHLASVDPPTWRGHQNSLKDLTALGLHPAPPDMNQAEWNQKRNRLIERRQRQQLARIATTLEDDPKRGKLLRALLNRWLDLAGAELRVAEQDNRPSLTIVPAREGGWLFTSLVTQITFLAAGTRRWLTCSGCGKPYVPKNVPRSGKHTYCQKCGRKAALRDAQARWREKHGKKKMNEQ